MAELVDLKFDDDLADLVFEEEISPQPSPKSIWSALGAEMNPQMQQAHPYLSAIVKSAQEAGVAPLHYVNQALLNIPRSLLERRGIQYPEPSTMAGQFLTKPAGVAGALTGLGAKLATAPARIIAGQGVGRSIARGALGGALTSGAYAPTSPEEAFFDWKERGKRAIMGGGLGGVSGLATQFPKLINLGGRKTAQAIAEKADKGFDKLSKGLSDKYDDLFANVKGTTKVDDILSTLDDTINQYPEGGGIGKLKAISSRLKKIQEGGEEITAKELHNLKQEISKTIPKSVWNGIADADAMTNARENVYWKITEKLEKLGGDKYKGLTSEYKNFKQAERLARKMFYRSGVPSDEALRKTYDIPTQRAVGKLSSQLPREEQFAQHFEAWRRGQGVKRIGAKIGLGYGAYEILKRVFGERR